MKKNTIITMHIIIICVFAVIIYRYIVLKESSINSVSVGNNTEKSYEKITDKKYYYSKKELVKLITRNDQERSKVTYCNPLESNSLKIFVNDFYNLFEIGEFLYVPITIYNEGNEANHLELSIKLIKDKFVITEYVFDEMIYGKQYHSLNPIFIFDETGKYELKLSTDGFEIYDNIQVYEKLIY